MSQGSSSPERNGGSGRSGLKAQRLVALCLLGVLLFNYPLLQLFARDSVVLGIPLLYCYVFCAWALLIGLIALVVERSDTD